jgi:hypothetical protein
MNTTLILAGLLLSSSSLCFAQELTFQVLGARNQLLFQTKTLASPSSLTVGRLSHAVLESALKQNLLNEYQGSESGVASINQLGGELEVLSSNEMNAYGWCFKVDGVLGELPADQTKFTGTESRVEWFFGYAHLEKDQWTSMCAPADHIPSKE